MSDQSSVNPATGDGAVTWRERQRATAAAHEEVLATRRRQESAAAREQIASFLRRVQAQKFGPQPVELRARSYDGKTRYKTPLTGWYLRKDETIGIDTTGKFYILTVPGSLSARFKGVTPTPSEPTLVLGAGGKDGESVDLSVALARLLGK